MSGTARVIKRYANRKLYDTQESCYVTLDQISEMIRRNEDVLVIDNATKEDLTSVTFAQIIFEEEKRKRSFLPLSVLRKMIEGGGESFLHDIMTQIQESAEKVGRVFRREATEQDGEGTAESDGQDPGQRDETDRDQGEQDEQEMHDGDTKMDPARMLREFVEGVQKTIDDWQQRVDANMHTALESVSPLAPLQKEVQSLRDRIGELEGHISDLKSGKEREDADTSDS